MSSTEWLLWEIQAGEIAVILSRCGIISASSGTLGIEWAEMQVAAIVVYSGLPFFVTLVPADTFVFWGAIFSGSLIYGVLLFSAEPKVSLCIVERIVVDVVANEVSRGAGYPAVHSDLDFFVWADSIEGVGLFCSGPFVADEFGVIFGVNEGEFALGEGNSSEGVTISQPAVKEKGPEQYALEPRVDF